MFAFLPARLRLQCLEKQNDDDDDDEAVAAATAKSIYACVLIGLLVELKDKRKQYDMQTTSVRRTAARLRNE